MIKLNEIQITKDDKLIFYSAFFKFFKKTEDIYVSPKKCKKSRRQIEAPRYLYLSRYLEFPGGGIPATKFQPSYYNQARQLINQSAIVRVCS